jgi:hypothetical protein
MGPANRSTMNRDGPGPTPSAGHEAFTKPQVTGPDEFSAPTGSKFGKRHATEPATIAPASALITTTITTATRDLSYPRSGVAQRRIVHDGGRISSSAHEPALVTRDVVELMYLALRTSWPSAWEWA